MNIGDRVIVRLGADQAYDEETHHTWNGRRGHVTDLGTTRANVVLDEPPPGASNPAWMRTGDLVPEEVTIPEDPW